MNRKILALATVVIFTTTFSRANLNIAEEKKEVKKTIAPNVQMSVGEKLIHKSDCSGCHTKFNKIIGPSYADIAKKYKNEPKNINLLADRIIKGSKGIWGTMPMTAHPKMSKADATAMVKYILTVKKP